MMENIHHAKINFKKVGVALLISYKLDFKTKINIYRKDYCIMKKGSIYQEYISLCVTVPNNRAAKYVKQKLLKLKGEVGQSNYI